MDKKNYQSVPNKEFGEIYTVDPDISIDEIIEIMNKTQVSEHGRCGIDILGLRDPALPDHVVMPSYLIFFQSKTEDRAIVEGVWTREQYEQDLAELNNFKNTKMFFGRDTLCDNFTKELCAQSIAADLAQRLSGPQHTI